MSYISDLATSFSCNAKLFAYETSFFSVTGDINTSASKLNHDLAKINSWTFKWKMRFNPDPTKQAQVVIFSQKSKRINHSQLLFNNNQGSQSSSQKHLDIIIDEQLTFCEHLKILTSKINKTIELIIGDIIAVRAIHRSYRRHL